MSDQRCSQNEVSKRDVPSFIEPRPPLVDHPFKRPKPQRGMNLLELFDEDSENEEPELVQVYLRLKPCKFPNTLYEVRSDKCLVTSLDTATVGHGRRTQHNVSKMYNFTKIFRPQCNQKEIFEQVVKDNLRKLPEGHNFTLLTYGASGSGKTYTVMGTVGSPGLVPRSLEYVFKLIDAAQQPVYKPAERGAVKLSSREQNNELQLVARIGQASAPHREKYRRMSLWLHNDLTSSSTDLSNRVQYYVWVQFIEIYNEAVYDLLAPLDKRTKLHIREDSSGNVYVKGATQVFVRSGEEAYNVMAAGKHNLVVAATGVHAQSSRSHCIFTINMLTETVDGVSSSCVRLCDLAGCERARATGNTGTRMQESRAINSSLHVLERCMHMLRKNQRSRHDVIVPYRESKLTRILGSGLSGSRGEAVSMVVTLNTSIEYAHETKHVLGLASVAQDIQITNTMLESRLESTSTFSTQDTTASDYSTDMLILRADNERLHYELARAQARCQELLEINAEMRRNKAKEMHEIVEEAKDLTQQYYETQLKIMQSQMDDMTEEYKSIISELKGEIAAERFARVRAEEKLLFICSKCKKDETLQNQTQAEEITVLSDSDQDSDCEINDPLNESLEPSFKNINHNDTFSLHTMDNIEEENDVSDNETSSVSSRDSDNLHVTDDTQQLKDGTAEVVDKEAVEHVEKSMDIDRSNTSQDGTENLIYDVVDNKDDSEIETTVNTTVDNVNADENNENKNEAIMSNSSRGTYFVSDNNHHNDISQENVKQNISSLRCTYFVKDITAVLHNQESYDSGYTAEDNQESVINKLDMAVSVSNNKTSLGFKEKSNNSGKSIASVISLEMPYNKEIANGFDMKSVFKKPDAEVFNGNSKVKNNISQASSDKCNNSSRDTYFITAPPPDVPQNSESDDTVNVCKHSVTTKPNTISGRDNETNQNLKDNMNIVENNSMANNVDVIKVPVLVQSSSKMSETLVTKFVKTLKVSQDNDSSLRQFEQLEKAMKHCDKQDGHNQSVFGNINILKGDRVYFDIGSNKISKETNPDKCKNVEKCNNFAKINSNLDESNNKANDIKNVNEERIISVVKENSVISDCKPSKITKLLDESFTKPEIITSAKKNRLAKKQESVDLFDSPIVIIPKDNIVIARDAVERLVLDKQDVAEKVTSLVEPRLSPKNCITHSTLEKETLQWQQQNEISPVNKGGSELLLKNKKNIFQDQIIAQSPLPKSAFDSPILVNKSFTKSSSKPKNINQSSDTFIKMKMEAMSSIEDAITIKDEIKVEPASSIDEPNQSSVESNSIVTNNTVEEFEKIFKELSTHRPTEFDLLVTQTVNEISPKVEKKSKEEAKYNLRKKANDSKSINSKDENTEVMVANEANNETKPRPMRYLRLRRTKKQDDDEVGKKLKDIGNLQTEFSDVTMDVPAPEKVVKDMPSPDKNVEENVNPILGIQSCPSKSVTRSRRKLFTPLPEPLEESLSQTGDSNERIRVPRPSYHRSRARRKL